MIIDDRPTGHANSPESDYQDSGEENNAPGLYTGELPLWAHDEQTGTLVDIGKTLPILAYDWANHQWSARPADRDP